METQVIQQIKMNIDQYITEFEIAAQQTIAAMPQKYTLRKKSVERMLSKEKLKSLMSEHGDVAHARLINDSFGHPMDTRWIFGVNSQRPDFAKQKIEGFKRSGVYGYPPNTYCGWHTNSNNEGERTYIIYADEDNKSFFRYYDEEKDEVVTKWEKKGININKFTISKEKPLWHCAGSFCNRISVGFNKIL